MALRDGLKPTGRKGVFFREHPTRKHGVRKDRQLVLRYTLGGKTYVESFGWASDGVGEIEAEAKIAEFRANFKSGSGPVCLADEKEIADQAKNQEAAIRAAESRKNMTLSTFFEETYSPHAKDHKKINTWKAEESLFRLWIAPVIGDQPFAKVAPFHLDKIKSNMRQGKREDTAPLKSKPRPLRPKSINDALAVVRQIWNHARREGIVKGDWPGRDVKKPVVQNQRIRFLTHEEATRLLDALAKTSPQIHDMALISLHCGLRAGEIFNLRWNCIDVENETLLLVDTKNNETRHAYMTPAVKAMFAGRIRAAGMDIQGNDLVFTTRKGRQVHEISGGFVRIADRIGLNDGITDPRRRITFHSLRHTYASWLVESGVDLYTCGKMLGHKSVHMTARYSHVGENVQRQAARTLAARLESPDSDKTVAIGNGS